MPVQSIQTTTVQNLQEKSDGVMLIDVREKDEFAEVASPYAKNYPLSNLDVNQVLKSLNLSLDETDTPLYFICRSGARSLRAANQFHAAGYTNIYNVEGGMNRWVELGLPTRK